MSEQTKHDNAGDEPTGDIASGQGEAGQETQPVTDEVAADLLESSAEERATPTQE